MPGIMTSSSSIKKYLTNETITVKTLKKFYNL